jgi:hypothetical protein
MARARKTTKMGELRPSQIVTTFGPGSVIDQPTASLIVAGTDFWSVGDDQRISEPRLEALLRVGHLYRPRVRSDGPGGGVPAFIFPEFLVCPRCGRLATYHNFHWDGRYFRCTNNHPKGDRQNGKPPRAFPARFVIACPAGHLADFPWSSYVHRGAPTECDPLELTFFESSRSGSLADLFVRCADCEKSRPLEAAFDPERAGTALGPCPGARPWLDDYEACNERPRTVLRGASNLYFSLVQSALSIPEWNDPIHEAIALHQADLEKVNSLDKLKVGIEMGFLSRLQTFAPEVVWEALKAQRELLDTPPTPQDIRREEFGALGRASNPADEDHREFETVLLDVPKRYHDVLDKLVMVRRLREVRALAAFTRIDSPPDLLLEDDEAMQRVQIQSLSRERSNWRPAVELLGEGVFITLNETKVCEWEDSDGVKKRYTAMRRVYELWRAARDLPPAEAPGSRFVLLHSLAHMLIGALSLDCGYSSASLRERIYSSPRGPGAMAGILLYTATPDSDGSLGGLADQAQPQRFERILDLSLRRAQYCSSDPLCGHAAPGEMGQANGAACHACLLVSETSCERANLFLDRAHVVPTVGGDAAAFFRIA